MEFHEKARATTAALLKLGEARKAHATARKIHQQSKVWRHDADPEDLHWQQKSHEALETAVCELKTAEAELRRIKLMKLTN
ncbi:hypothetical protein ACTOV4_10155 [Brucella sp. C7-11G]